MLWFICVTVKQSLILPKIYIYLYKDKNHRHLRAEWNYL